MNEEWLDTVMELLTEIITSVYSKEKENKKILKN